MKAEREKLLQAYIEVYNDFAEIYKDHTESFWNDDNWDINERAKLFEIAMKDSILGEVLKEEILQRYQEILEAEQAKQEAEEEAQAGEAMVI